MTSQIEHISQLPSFITQLRSPSVNHSQNSKNIFAKNNRITVDVLTWHFAMVPPGGKQKNLTRINGNNDSHS